MTQPIPPAKPDEEKELEPLPTAEELQEAIDAAVPEAIRVLDKLQSKADRDSTRVSAAKEILERSSIAPQKKIYQQGAQAGVIIQIGMQKMGQIKAALADVDDHETIKLLEGEYEIGEEE